ncbi:MAG: GNAT family N-acetyltransferase [Candidatus Thermoplasmatota archaeon]|nr:GNAT family N-acetyltransferase [Euryarchaeota archaeon]MBU4032131.1 GNAT family N-acetyltransferase [Candidatus Thermoplasmatota archaeon]MBU4071215.1 GNAT family N-acetyltransferase [Candidatus Thermoplasmatota archaeon]MBU4145064.1 GNAT family N-acetyltransferase [Candidatus Thermoplasmatota archaeon]MBU4592782.1 GNAT family N-acetyltransferase [Candidatus Thermoplasmatota archaeon]
MDLKTLSPDDYDAIISVWETAGLGYRPKGRDSCAEITRQMALDPDMWLGSFVGEELVGIIIGSYDSRKAWLNRLAVIPQHQGKGIARALVNEMEGRLRARGFHIITVLIEGGHEASFALFTGNGYEVFENIRYLRKLDDPDV